MGSRLERREIIDRGSPLSGHSLNQKRLKYSRQGEERIVDPKRGFTQVKREDLVAPSENPLFAKLQALAKKQEQAGTSIPIRLGEISLAITANVNLLLRTNQPAFVEKYRDIRYVEEPWNERYTNLIPQSQMIANFFRKHRGFQKDPNVMRGVVLSADIFARSLGQIKFDDTTQVTVGSAMVAHDNICALLAMSLSQTPSDGKNLRSLVVTFGETICHELSKPPKFPVRSKKISKPTYQRS